MASACPSWGMDLTPVYKVGRSQTPGSLRWLGMLPHGADCPSVKPGYGEQGLCIKGKGPAGQRSGLKLKLKGGAPRTRPFLPPCLQGPTPCTQGTRSPWQMGLKGS